VDTRPPDPSEDTTTTEAPDEPAANPAEGLPDDVREGDASAGDEAPE
jgi:hypothetical protein